MSFKKNWRKNSNFLDGDMNNPVELLNQIKDSLIFFQNLKNISMMKILNHSLYNQTKNSSKLTLCLVARGRGGPKPEQACKKRQQE